MAIDDQGHTKYESAYNFEETAKRRLGLVQQNEAQGDAYANFRSQLDTNQAAFDENIRLRQAGLRSLSVGSRNAESMSQYGADLLGRVQQQFQYYTPPAYSGGGSSGGSSSGGSSGGGPIPAGNFGAFTRAIAEKESGGSYSAVNRDSGALGKYQIMPFNIASWSQQALGRTISPSQFLSSPQYQEQIAQYHLRNYYNKYGPAGAAVAWYAGPAAADRFKASGYASQSPEGNYPSVYGYVNNIMAAMRNYL